MEKNSPKKQQNNKKDIKFRILPKGSVVPDLFLMRTDDEDGIEIHFAKKKEKKDSIEVSIVSIVKLKKDDMITFGLDYINALHSYEEKFKNGFGLEGNKNDGSDSEK